MLIKPGTMQTQTRFKAQVYILTKEEGGGHRPFFTGYEPPCYFRTTDATGSVRLQGDGDMVTPGDNVELEVQLQAPVALEERLQFAIREGGRTVGSGVIGSVIE